MHRLPDAIAGLDSWRAAMIAVALPGPLFAALVATLRLIRAQATSSDTGSGEGFLLYARRHLAVLLGIFGSVAAYNVSLGATILFIPTALPRLFDITPATIGIRFGGVLAVATIGGLSVAAAALRVWPWDWAQAPLRISQLLFASAVVPTVFLPFVTASWQVFAIAGVELFAAFGAASMLRDCFRRSVRLTCAAASLRCPRSSPR